MIVYVDVDGVVADLLPVWLDRYNNDSGDNLRPGDITDWSLSRFVKPEWKQKIYEYLDDPSLYDYVQPVEDAWAGLERLRDQDERNIHTVFATSTPNKSAGRKYRWLWDYGFLASRERPDRDYIEISDKSHLGQRGDVLVDDGLHNLIGFRGTGILFNTVSNQNVKWPLRVCGWNHLTDLLIYQSIPMGTHPTEISRPKQCREFVELVEKMYKVHLDKNQDYSPANILGTGEIGLMTREWDKVSRLMNLMGYKIEVNSMKFEKPQEPKNESIDDNIQDLTVYGLIWQLYRKGAWGK